MTVPVFKEVKTTLFGNKHLDLVNSGEMILEKRF